MKTLNIFAHKGRVACNITMTGKFINNPSAAGQMGCVVSTSEVTISKEAADIIRGAKREGGSFAPLMLTVHEGEAVVAHGPSSIGVLGVGKVYLGTSDDLTIGRTCDLKALDDCEVIENNPPEDFVEFVNGFDLK